ncbi:hypothetical protein DPMN_079607 [Dreissena polymorpha]|uniref:Uncharacterized protein n=1 Tax=Dreissena polymorpha TaxID=45954 RepID=A0A9D4BII0_DREPO|nr:hypothetical protein DPMN_079607 [Dreissena polymorpha]
MGLVPYVVRQTCSVIRTTGLRVRACRFGITGFLVMAYSRFRDNWLGHVDSGLRIQDNGLEDKGLELVKSGLRDFVLGHSGLRDYGLGLRIKGLRDYGLEDSWLGHYIEDYGMMCRFRIMGKGDYGLRVKKCRIRITGKGVRAYSRLGHYIEDYGMDYNVLGRLRVRIRDNGLWVRACRFMTTYITLLKEKNTSRKGENPFFHLLLQFLGMMLGGGIMFVIAIFEADLKTLLE